MFYINFFVSAIGLYYAGTLASNLVMDLLCHKLRVPFYPNGKLAFHATRDQERLYTLFIKITSWQLLSSWLCGTITWVLLPHTWESIVYVVGGATLFGLLVTALQLLLARCSLRIFTLLSS